MERTLVILKPDAFGRRLLGELTSLFERRGLFLLGCKMALLDRGTLDQHYAHIVERSFYSGVADYMQSAPVLIQCWGGPEAVSVVRSMVGVTNARVAEPGTIRGTYGLSGRLNLVHASDSLQTAEVEVARYFASQELFEPPRHLVAMVLATDEA